MTSPAVAAYDQPRVQTPEETKTEILDHIKAAIAHHPRTLQKHIGPSELGHPCARRIGYKLAGAPDLNEFPDAPWKPTIGTAVHAWLEDVFAVVNHELDPTMTNPRYLIELTVCVGQVAGVDITGHCDLYDRATRTAIDWKIVGDTPLKNYRRKGPGGQYRSQIHLYGRGLHARGLPVEQVVIAFLPRNGELRDAYFWTEPYDEQVALDALQRANGIGLATQLGGAAALANLPTADAYCRRCPYYKYGSMDLAQGCPGDPVMNAAAQPALTIGGAP